MFQITPSESGADALEYYCKALAMGDYLAVETGNWHGKGAERLGLHGEVQRKDFASLAMNMKPGDKERLTARTRKDRRAGYDHMFSVPKSVSIYSAETSDKLVEELIQEAFHETMEDIESNMQARVRVNGEQHADRTTGNLIYASFVHRETRPVNSICDPQYHIHGYCFNATYDDVEKKWKAGEFGNIKANAPKFQTEVNARLASKLVKAGYAIRRTANSFELANVSKDLIDKFSKRKQQIEKIIQVKGITSKAEKAKIGLQSREKKSKCTLPPAALLAYWRTQMTAEERESLQTVNVKAAKSNVLSAEQAKDLTIEHLFENDSTIEKTKAITELLKRGLGSVTVEQARKWVAQDVRFIRDTGDTVSTRDILAEERAFLDTTHAGKNRFEAIGRGGVYRHDEGEQSTCINDLLESRSLVTSLRGPAGSGKTTLMAEAVPLIEKLSGCDVLLFAPSSGAVRVLKDEGHTRSETFQMFQKDELLQQVAAGQILWIDEAGFLSAKQMKWLVQFAEKNGCRVILSGDTRQHHSVARGDAMRLLEESRAVSCAGLSTIHRQKRDDLRAAIQDLSEGNPANGFLKLEIAGVPRQFATDSERQTEAARMYLQAASRKKSCLIVAPTHSECRAIASVVRLQEKQLGLIGADERTIDTLRKRNLTASERRDPTSYQPEDVIVPHSNIGGAMKPNTQHSVDNLPVLPLSHADHYDVYRAQTLTVSVGDRVRVTKGFSSCGVKYVNNELLRVTKLGDGCVITNRGAIDTTKPVHLDQGVCITSHAAQGKTVDVVIVSAPVASFSQVNTAQFYVSMSRAREAMHLLTDNLSALRHSVCRTNERLSATSWVEQAHAALTPDEIHAKIVAEYSASAASRSAGTSRGPTRKALLAAEREGDGIHRSISWRPKVPCKFARQGRVLELP